MWLAMLHLGLQPKVQTQPTRIEAGLTMIHAFSPIAAVEVQGSIIRNATGGNFDSSHGPIQAYPAKITSDFTAPKASASAMLLFSPINGEVFRPTSTSFAVDVGAGFGVLHTVDDLDALQATDDPVAIATESQWHPTLNWTMGPRVALSSRWEARLRLSGSTWVETFEGVNLTLDSRMHGSFAVAVRL